MIEPAPPAPPPARPPSGPGPVRRFCAGVHRGLSRPILGTPRQGVRGLWDPKWVVVFVLYALAVGTMARDPWFGADTFAWNQGVLALVMAGMVVSAVAFEWGLLGEPKGVNLLLHAVLVFPTALCFGRILGRPTEPAPPDSLLGKAWELGRTAVEAAGIDEFVPAWLQEVLTSPGLFLFLLFLAAALSARSVPRRAGLLGAGLLAATAAALAYPPRPSAWFWLGGVLRVLGFRLERLEARGLARGRAVFDRLGGIDDADERRAAVGIARRALRDGEVGEPAVAGIVRDAYADRADPGGTLDRARAVSYRLVCERGALAIRGTQRGFVLAPPDGPDGTAPFLAAVSFWPRQILLLGVALVWLLSPLDLIPDAVPVVGLLDDAALLVVSSTPLVRAWLDDRRSSRPRPAPPPEAD